jgi:hypothetical protein
LWRQLKIKQVYDVLPDMGSLEARLLDEISGDVQRRYAISQLRKIQEASLNDTIWVQDTAMRFKQQELIKSVQEINRIISKGDNETYEELL